MEILFGRLMDAIRTQLDWMRFYVKLGLVTLIICTVAMVVMLKRRKRWVINFTNEGEWRKIRIGTFINWYNCMMPNLNKIKMSPKDRNCSILFQRSHKNKFFNEKTHKERAFRHESRIGQMDACSWLKSWIPSVLSKRKWDDRSDHFYFSRSLSFMRLNYFLFSLGFLSILDFLLAQWDFDYYDNGPGGVWHRPPPPRRPHDWRRHWWRNQPPWAKRRFCFHHPQNRFCRDWSVEFKVETLSPVTGRKIEASRLLGPKVNSKPLFRP